MLPQKTHPRQCQAKAQRIPAMIALYEVSFWGILSRRSPPSASGVATSNGHPVTQYQGQPMRGCNNSPRPEIARDDTRSEEHTSELQSHSFISYAVFCLKKKK